MLCAAVIIGKIDCTSLTCLKSDFLQLTTLYLRALHIIVHSLNLKAQADKSVGHFDFYPGCFSSRFCLFHTDIVQKLQQENKMLGKELGNKYDPTSFM